MKEISKQSDNQWAKELYQTRKEIGNSRSSELRAKGKKEEAELKKKEAAALREEFKAIPKIDYGPLNQAIGHEPFKHFGGNRYLMHPGIEKILEAAQFLRGPCLCVFGGLHLVLAQESEIRRVVTTLRDRWSVKSIAPGHCTGEPAFAAIREIFGEQCLFAGLGERIGL